MSDAPGRISLQSPFTCYYAFRAPQGGGDAPPLVLGLHGWGMNCESFLRRLGPLADAGCAVAALQAPNQFYLDMASKKVGFHWLTVYEKEQSIRDIQTYIENVLDDLAGRLAYDPARVYVLGFSQGVSIAWRFAVRTARPIAGLVACCADLPPDVAERLPETTPFPALLTHAVDDAVIPRAKLDEAVAVLQAIHWPHDMFTYEGGHEVVPEAAANIAAWLQARAAGTPPEIQEHGLS
ncbi:MAG: alpha/beta fold hydrolase [Candidatus Hydrogenedens sp.]|nr:alpha/beta fold hydrolase [Candidatus Hydrogenedens sp.]